MLNSQQRRRRRAIRAAIEEASLPRLELPADPDSFSRSVENFGAWILGLASLVLGAAYMLDWL